MTYLHINLSSFYKQVKYDRMIELLEGIKSDTEKIGDYKETQNRRRQ